MIRTKAWRQARWDTKSIELIKGERGRGCLCYGDGRHPLLPSGFQSSHRILNHSGSISGQLLSRNLSSGGQSILGTAVPLGTGCCLIALALWSVSCSSQSLSLWDLAKNLNRENIWHICGSPRTYESTAILSIYFEHWMKELGKHEETSRLQWPGVLRSSPGIYLKPSGKRSPMLGRMILIVTLACFTTLRDISGLKVL